MQMMYNCQSKQSLNDKYKSQNCRAFYREKFCFYGKRCHFRHEYRSFSKIHRHFYMAHLCALRHSNADMLSESRALPDGSKREQSMMGRDHSDLSTDSGSEEEEHLVVSGSSRTRRLAVFQAITASTQTEKTEVEYSYSSADETEKKGVVTGRTHFFNCSSAVGATSKRII